MWCDKLLLFDTVAENRKSFDWELDRAFNNGYLKIFSARKAGQDIERKLYKTIFDLFVFSGVALFSFLILSRYKCKLLLKFMDCLGKIRSIYSAKAYTHY